MRSLNLTLELCHLPFCESALLVRLFFKAVDPLAHVAVVVSCRDGFFERRGVVGQPGLHGVFVLRYSEEGSSLDQHSSCFGEELAALLDVPACCNEPFSKNAVDASPTHRAQHTNEAFGDVLCDGLVEHSLSAQEHHFVALRTRRR